MNEETNFGKYRWAETLEEWIKLAVESNCDKIAITGLNDKGEFCTGITPGTSPYETLMLGAKIMSDAVLDIVLANADLIVNTAKDIEAGQDETKE